jgi:hypothetical protein
LAALQRTFVGSIVPLEIFEVTNTTLSPQAFCEFLQKFNPGALTKRHVLVFAVSEFAVVSVNKCFDVHLPKISKRQHFPSSKKSLRTLLIFWQIKSAAREGFGISDVSIYPQ